jgi:type VI secretion system protein ImpA
MAACLLVDIEPLLAPIESGRPSGTSFLYQPEYDAVRLARRSDDDSGPQGNWARKAKPVDWDRVVRLGCELLAQKSKDLQIAAWVTEALTRRDGFAGLSAGLRIVRQIQDTFWDSYFPRLEDDDPESRHGPFNFLDSVLPVLIRSQPITAGRGPESYSFLSWKESRATDNAGLRNASAMEALVAEGKITSKQFDEQAAQTPRAFYETLRADIARCLDDLKELDQSNDAHFGADAPGLGRIREALEDCLATVESILGPCLSDSAHQHDDAAEPIENVEQVDGRVAAVRREKSSAIVDTQDACRRIVEASAFLRREDSTSPIPYLVVRALQAGRIYKNADRWEVSQCDAPMSETRRTMLKLATDGDWEQLLEQAELALGRPEGLAWLDVHRDAQLAMAELGGDFAPARAASCSFLRMLLIDFPWLAETELNDGTPCASSETGAWLRDEIMPAAAMMSPAPACEPATAIDTLTMPERTIAASDDTDPWDEARIAIREGRAEDGLAIIRRASASAVYDRDRFVRTLQLAEICETLNRRRVALSLAEELARQIDEYRLERWEGPALCGRVWALLFRCHHTGSGDADASERSRSAFARLCRLDVEHALACDGCDAGR